MTPNDPAADAPSVWGEARSRTATWYDARVGVAQGARLSGIEYLRAMREQRLPPAPITGLLRFELADISEGRVSFTCWPDESMYNPIGSVHGGVVCTLLDSVCGCAIHSTLPAGRAYTSVEIKVSYLKAVRADSGPLTAIGTLLKGGRRVAFTEGVVVDASGAAVATATSTLLVFDVDG